MKFKAKNQARRAKAKIKLLPLEIINQLTQFICESNPIYVDSHRVANWFRNDAIGCADNYVLHLELYDADGFEQEIQVTEEGMSKLSLDSGLGWSVLGLEDAEGKPLSLDLFFKLQRPLPENLVAAIENARSKTKG